MKTQLLNEYFDEIKNKINNHINQLNGSNLEEKSSQIFEKFKEKDTLDINFLDKNVNVKLVDILGNI